jgi:GT2 family glycosyltransferase
MSSRQFTVHRPCITVIIPSLNGEVDALIQSLTNQTWKPDLVKVVRGVRPNGRARNLGVAASKRSFPEAEDILIFIDDDVQIKITELIEKLVEPLLGDSSIGMTGAARVLPSSAPWFQRRVAAEIPRTVNEVPETPLETNPPLKGYGHSLITTTCCAIKRSVYEEAGGFSDTLTSGVDTDFFYRVRQLGYRFLMVASVSVEHPAPANLRSLLRKFHWYGIGYGQEAQRRPEQHMGPKLPTSFHQSVFLLLASFWFIPNIFILYSYGYPHLRVGFRPLKALSTYAVAWGYVKGWRRGTS